MQRPQPDDEVRAAAHQARGEFRKTKVGALKIRPAVQPPISLLIWQHHDQCYEAFHQPSGSEQFLVFPTDGPHKNRQQQYTGPTDAPGIIDKDVAGGDVDARTLDEQLRRRPGNGVTYAHGSHCGSGGHPNSRWNLRYLTETASTSWYNFM